MSSSSARPIAGRAPTDAATQHFAPVPATRHLSLTLQVDEGPAVLDAKFGNLHPLFKKD